MIKLYFSAKGKINHEKGFYVALNVILCWFITLSAYYGKVKGAKSFSPFLPAAELSASSLHATNVGV